MLLKRHYTLLVLVTIIAFACNSPTAPFEVDATVRIASSVEGPCWSIVTAPNKAYTPVDLPAAFRTDGLAVRVELRDAPGWISICRRCATGERSAAAASA